MRVNKSGRTVSSAIITAAAMGSIGLIANQSRAANDVWTPSTSVNWADLNWSGGNNPPQSGDSLEFGSQGSFGTTLIDNLTTGSGFSLSGITFDSSAPAYIINPASASNNFSLTGAITNNAGSLETINDAMSVAAVQTITGNGNTTLGGSISGAGGFLLTGSGVVTLAGNDTLSGTTTVNGGSTLVLAGNNTYTGNLVLHNGGTLQLQANAANTTAGVSDAMGNPGAFQFSDGGQNNSTYVQLRSDTSVTFSNTATGNDTGNYPGPNTLNFDVNSLSGSTTGKTLSFGAIGTYRTVFNVTGGNGYSLALGGISNGNGGDATLNPTTANLSIGNIAGVATLYVEGSGTTTLTGTTTASNLNVTGSGAALYQGPGTTTTVSSQIKIGDTAGQYGYYNISGGTVNVGELDVSGGDAAGTGVVDISGGTLNVNGWFLPNRAGNGTAIVNLNGGTFNYTPANNRFELNWSGTSTGVSVVNIAHSNLNASGTTLSPMGAQYGGTPAAGCLGVINLNSGGTLQVQNIMPYFGTGSTGTALINFNGGTLKATAATTDFVEATSAGGIYVYSGGGTIDNNGVAITIASTLAAPTGYGVTSIPVTSGGSGYTGSPAVTITGDGTGATAVGTVVNGALTAITVTSPGFGYTAGSSSATVNIVGGGSGASYGTISTAVNVGGGITFQGVGTTTLTGSNTYTGATAVSAGKVVLSGSGSINSSSIINVAGGTLIQLSSVPVSAPVTVGTGGILDGTTTFNTVSVGTGGTLNTGNGSTTASLTIGSLTFTGAGAVNLNTSLATSTSAQLLTTTLSTASTKTLINITDSDSSWVAGTYDLIGYSGTLGGSGLAGFGKGTLFPAIGGRQSASLTTVGSGSSEYLALVVAGDAPKWTGAYNGNWTTATLPSPKNWQLITAGTPTDYITGDNVTFDDSATGTTTISISSANVTPSSIAFNNSAKNYTLNGPYGITGSTGMVLSGTGTVTLNTADSYTGTTVLNSGTLNINTPTAIGSGHLTINGGTIDNTSGSAVALTTNNVQSWNADLTFGGTNALNLGTGAVTLSASRNVTVNGSAPVTVGGGISGTGFSLTKSGPGILVLGGSNGYDSGTNVSAGILTVTGSITNPFGVINVGTASGVNAVLAISGGSVAASDNVGEFTSSLIVGGVSGGVGDIQMTGGSLTTHNQLGLGNGAGGFGGLSISGGAITSGTFLVVGLANDDAVVNQTGGTITISNDLVTVGAQAGADGVVNVTGGTLNSTATTGSPYGTIGGMFLGENSTGVLNVSGTGTVQLSGNGLSIGTFGTGAGTANLLTGGTIITTKVSGGAGSGTFNFNGGTLKASASSTTFMSGLKNAYIYSGGATIDDGGFSINVAQPLLAPTGSGVSAAGLSISGSGYVETPVVQITGGGGTGATAVATINASGTLTGITITSPGVGYTSAPTIALLGGGGNASVNGSATLVTNSTAGGLTKNGAGVLTLSSISSTYGGPTTVNAGTLRLSTVAQPTLKAAYSVDGLTSLPSSLPNNAPGAISATTGAINNNGGLSLVSGPSNLGASSMGLSFNGDGSNVQISNGITDLSGAGSWTVSAWVQSTTPGSTILDKSDGGWTTGNSIFYLGNGTGGTGSYPTAVRYAGGWNSGQTSVTDGGWHMVTYVDNAGTESIYVDGVAAVTNPYEGGFGTADAGGTVYLGYTTDGGDGTANMNGALADLNFYSGPLSQTEITSLYNTNTIPAAPTSVLPSTTAVNLTATGTVLDIDGDIQPITSLNGASGTLVALGGGSLIVNGTLSTTFGGNIADAGGASNGTGGSLVKLGTSTLTLTGSMNYSGQTYVGGGTLIFAKTGTGYQTLNLPGGLNIGSGAVTKLAAVASSANRTLLTVGSLSLAGSTSAWTGKLDLANNDLDVQNGNLAIISNMVAQGYAHGTWNGSGGIVSSSAAADSRHLTALGVVLNSTVAGVLHSTFDGQAAASTDVLVKYTYYGDANLDGKVDGSDYSLVDSTYASEGFSHGVPATAISGWYNGDFNYDGVVNGSDYTLMDNAFNMQGAQISTQLASSSALIAGSGATSAVPEPASLGLLGIAITGLLGRRSLRRR